jgi:Skp family chaperone for outer membrane proteins
VIDRLGKQKGFWLVVERSRGGVLYATAEADLTDEVIRAYDQDVQTKGTKK